MLVAAAAGAVALAVQVSARPAWVELRTDRYVLRGNVETARFNAVACDLDTAQRLLAFSPAAATAPVPLVVAVGTAGDVREWLPQFWERRGPRPLGAYWAGPYGHHIVVRVDARPAERFRRVLHEYAHFATHLAHPEPPVWLDEGLSEIWEHASVENGEVELGGPVEEHRRALGDEKRWIPVEALISATAVPAGNGRTAAMFYAGSWALAHYLVFQKTGGSFLGHLPDRSAFPTDDELRRYVTGRLPTVKMSTVPAAGPDCTGGAVATAVSAFDLLIFKARALADGERPEAALPLLQQALAMQPGETAALETLGFVHFVGNRPAEAAAVFDRLIAAGDGSHIAYYYRAMLAGPVPMRGGGAGPVPEIEYLREALRLEPGFAPARERLRELTGK